MSNSHAPAPAERAETAIGRFLRPCDPSPGADATAGDRHKPESLPAPNTAGLFTKKGAADYLLISPSYVEFLTRRGELPAVRFGRNCVRFRKADLDDFVRRHVHSRAAQARAIQSEAGEAGR
jgi:excisionase family DNA binding protein